MGIFRLVPNGLVLALSKSLKGFDLGIRPSNATAHLGALLATDLDWTGPNRSRDATTAPRYIMVEDAILVSVRSGVVKFRNAEYLCVAYGGLSTFSSFARLTASKRVALVIP